MELQISEVMLPDLVEDLFATLVPLAQQTNTQLELRCENGLGAIRTDPRRVRQILLNLISNAIKFGEGRPVEVSCSSLPDGVAVAVSDRGVGIDAADLPRVFEEFVQLPNDRAGGTGLDCRFRRGWRSCSAAN